MQINASDNTPGSSPLIGLGSHNAGLFNLREVNPKLLPELLKKIHERISYGSSPIADPVASEFAISLVTLGDAAAITPGASWLDLIHTPHADDLTDDPIRVIGAIGANASKIIRTFLDSRSDKQSTLSALKGRLRTGFTKLVNEQPLKDRKAALEALVSEPSGSETLTRFLITLVKGCKALSAGVDSDSHLRMWGLVKELKKYSAGRYDKRSILFQDDGANILESAKLTNESKEKISNSLDDIYIGALFKELLEDYAANLEQTTSQAAQVSKTKASWGPTLAWVGSLASLGTILTVFLNSGGNAEPANQPAVNVMSAKDVVAAMHKVVTEVTVSPSALAKQINEAGSLEELAGKGLNFNEFLKIRNDELRSEELQEKIANIQNALKQISPEQVASFNKPQIEFIANFDELHELAINQDKEGFNNCLTEQGCKLSKQQSEFLFDMFNNQFNPRKKIKFLDYSASPFLPTSAPGSETTKIIVNLRVATETLPTANTNTQTSI